jgi:hypothetical protein
MQLQNYLNRAVNNSQQVGKNTTPRPEKGQSIQKADSSISSNLSYCSPAATSVHLSSFRYSARKPSTSTSVCGSSFS